MAEDDLHALEELKGLSALYALLCYAIREVQGLDAPCPEATSAIAAAQAAIHARMSDVQTKALQGETGDGGKTRLN